MDCFYKKALNIPCFSSSTNSYFCRCKHWLFEMFLPKTFRNWPILRKVQIDSNRVEVVFFGENSSSDIIIYLSFSYQFASSQVDIFDFRFSFDSSSQQFLLIFVTYFLFNNRNVGRRYFVEGACTHCFFAHFNLKLFCWKIIDW